MIWVIWRQHRTTILAAVGAVLLLAVVAVICGSIIGRENNAVQMGRLFGCSPGDGLAACRADSTLTLISLITVVLPVLLGLLVGVTVFSRDIDRGTHVVGLSQSVSRARWYWMRILVVFVPVTVAMAILGAAIEWGRVAVARTNYADISGYGMSYSRLTLPVFQSSGLVAGAYTLLALIMGSALALLLRNTLGAMAVTLVAMTALTAGFELGARPHYATASIAVRQLDLRGSYAPPEFMGENLDIWILTSEYVDASGRSVHIDDAACSQIFSNAEYDERPDETRAEYVARTDRLSEDHHRAYVDCLRSQGADHFETRYFPDSLFRRFQLTEAALALALSAILLVPSLWALRRLRP